MSVHDACTLYAGGCLRNISSVSPLLSVIHFHLFFKTFNDFLMWRFMELLIILIRSQKMMIFPLFLFIFMSSMQQHRRLSCTEGPSSRVSSGLGCALRCKWGEGGLVLEIYCIGHKPTVSSRRKKKRLCRFAVRCREFCRCDRLAV